MAVDKLVVLKAIEEKFKGKSLTKNFKENLATKWAEKIETDSDIDGYIDDREDVILEANAEADRRAIAAAKTAKEKNTEDKVDDKEDDKIDPNDTNALLKQLIAKQTALDEKLAGFEASNKAKSIQERFFADDRIKNVNLPESVKAKYVPTNEEDFDKMLESFETDFKPLIEANVLGAYKQDTPRSGDRQNPTEPKKISAEDAKKIVENMN